jgi:hypothetical protein
MRWLQMELESSPIMYSNNYTLVGVEAGDGMGDAMICIQTDALGVPTFTTVSKQYPVSAHMRSGGAYTTAKYTIPSLATERNRLQQ